MISVAGAMRNDALELDHLFLRHESHSLLHFTVLHMVPESGQLLAWIGLSWIISTGFDFCRMRKLLQ